MAKRPTKWPTQSKPTNDLIVNDSLGNRFLQIDWTKILSFLFLSSLLLSFIRLADYLIVGTLHILAVNSVQSLFNYYTEQLENTPSLHDIQTTNKILHKKTEEEKLAEEAAKEQQAQAQAAAAASNDPAQKEAARKDMMMMPQVTPHTNI